jgi:hypothetical protein
MLSLTGGLGEDTVAAGFMAVEAGFMGVEAFAAGPGSQAFAAGVGSAAFAGGALGSFAAMAVFLGVVVFSVPVSKGNRGGGVGVIPIIGVTRITHITRHTTVTMGMGTRRSPEEGVMLALLFRIA